MSAKNAELQPICELPLATRYQAAWGEHTARTGQRQSILQFYLATIGAIYGQNLFGKQPLGYFFLVDAVSGVTIISAILIFLQNRVIHRLVDFMAKCEKDSQVYIESTSLSGGLFYFHIKKAGVLSNFHFFQRLSLRLTYTLILVSVNLFTVIYTDSNTAGVGTEPSVIFTRTFGFATCLFAIVAMFLDLFLDRFHLVGNDEV